MQAREAQPAHQGEYEAIVEELVAAGAEAGKMFGMPCVKRGGKALAGYVPDAMIFKLGGEPHTRALALAGSRLFDPAGGRPMKEWVEVPAVHVASWPSLGQAAMAYASSTPDKVKKPKKAR